MKNRLLTLIVLILTQSSISQTNSIDNKKEIHKMLNTFMECLVKKDSTKFYNLFHTDPVVWVGITQQKSFANEQKKDRNAVENFSDSYKSFYRNFYKNEVEEKFYNIQILDDGYIASVIFDYSFWFKDKKLNWGKESWGLIKVKGRWYITSVLFSIEYEAINPEPKIKKAKQIGK